MPRIITPDSEEGKELLKWEQYPSNWNGEHIPAGNPYVYREYPRMLYKAVERNGRVTCLEPTPSPYTYATAQEYDRAVMLNEHQNRECTCTVHSAREHAAKTSSGWRDTPTEALKHYESIQQEMARVAAEVAYDVQRMSEKARAEHKAATDATEHQVTDIVPKRKGRKPGPRAKSGAQVIATE